MAVREERREVAGFDEVRLEGAGQVFIEQGETEGLVIEADEALLPKLKTEVVNGRLTLGLKHWYDFLTSFGLGEVRYHIAMRQVHAAAISGSGAIQAARVETDRLKLSISGSGRQQVDSLTAGALEVRFSGAGTVQVSGAAEKVDVQISGSGDLRAAGLESQETQVRISGSGRVEVQVATRLDVHISGSGDVSYRGSPAISQHISGAGRVHQV